ncbi:hypothetical protein MVEG_08005 [Podila verticillata NRRL 6337]|nr:hypothetical protein MVEG_08005 [Podila verticillata NRRL 6337]
MQRNNDHNFVSEDKAFVRNPTSANVNENLNATSSHANQNPTAKAMRSGQQHEVAYEVAGPTVGGMAPHVTSYDPDSITDSMSKTKISEDTSTTTARKPVGTSMTDSVSNAGNFASHHDAPAGPMDSPHPHPIASMYGMPTQIQSQNTSAATSYSAPKPAHVEPIHSTGLNTPVAPTHPTHYHTTHHVPKDEVTTAGVIGPASATLAAPPVNDTIMASHDSLPSESSNEGLAKMASTSTPSTLTPAEEKHLHEHSSSIKDKVKSVFHRRPSAQAAAEAEAAAAVAAKPKGYDAKLDRSEAVPETPYTSSGTHKADLHAAPGNPAMKLDAHPTTTLNQGHSSRYQEAPGKTSTTAPVVGAAAAGTAVYGGAKAKDAKDAKDDVVDSASNLTNSTKSTTPPTPHSTPIANRTSYTPSSVPAFENTANKTTTAEPSRPLAEKITAPVAGAAATGTAAYLGNKAKYANDPVTDSTNKLAHGTQQTTAASYSTPSKTTSAHTTPAVNSTGAYSAPAVEKTTMTPIGPLRPPTDKTTAPALGASSAVGAATAGTAAYMGSKARDSKEGATGTTPASAYNASSYPTTTTATTPAVSSYSTKPPVNTSSAYTTATSGAPAPATGTYPKVTTTPSSSGETPVIPASYKGPIPKAGPGEEVVWVKTTTTTDYYDTDKGPDTSGDVVESHQDVLDPNSFQTEHDNVTKYINDGHGGQRPQK